MRNNTDKETEGATKSDRSRKSRGKFVQTET